jgi:protein TonB
VPVTPVVEPPRPASTEVAVSASAAVPAEPAPAAPPMAPAPAAEPPPLVAARFDAEYLHNPAPSYPPLSRRRGEQGTVMLMVKVSAEGFAQRVEVHESCGYPRLDAAALEAVRAWRFVPARRGDAAVAASVLVPIAFVLGA